jgi:hypothetical protein
MPYPLYNVMPQSGRFGHARETMQSLGDLGVTLAGIKQKKQLQQQQEIQAQEQEKAKNVFNSLSDPARLISVGNLTLAKKSMEDLSKMYIDSGDSGLQKLGTALSNLIPSMDEGSDKVQDAIYDIMHRIDPERAKSLIDLKGKIAGERKTRQEIVSSEQDVLYKEQQTRGEMLKAENYIRELEDKEANTQARLDELEQRKVENLTAEEQKEQGRLKRQLQEQQIELEREKLNFQKSENVRSLVSESNKVQDQTVTIFNEMSGYLKDIIGVAPDSFGAGAFDKYSKMLQTAISGEEWGKGGAKMTALRTLGKKLQINAAMQNRVEGSGAMSDFETKSLMQTSLPDGASKEATIDWVNARLNALRSIYAMENIKKAYYQQNKTDWPTGKGGVLEISGKKVPFGPNDDAQSIIWRLGEKVRNFAPEQSISPSKSKEDIKSAIKARLGK